MKYGLNLYSIRDLIATPESFGQTMKSLKSMGYEYIQVSGVSLDAQTVKDAANAAGLQIKLTHSPLDRILNDSAALAKDHDIMGADYIGLGGIDSTGLAEKEAADKTVKMLEDAAIRFKALGKKFMYHNHNFEFKKVDNKISFYDYLIENTRELNFIFDTYWIQMGGVNVLEYIRKLKGRIKCVHLKDFKLEGIVPRYAALGDGNMNFPALIEEMKNSGTEYFFVEQDDAVSYPQPLKEIEKSIKYLQKLG